jgi:hypothetical protein
LTSRLIRIAVDLRPHRHRELQLPASELVSQERLDAFAERHDANVLASERMAGEASQARHQPLEPLDLFFADLHVLSIEGAADGREDAPEEIDGVANLVGDLRGDGLHEGRALVAPRRGLLSPARFELAVSVGVCERESALIDDGPQQVEIVLSKKGAARLLTDAQPAEAHPAELDQEAQLLDVRAQRLFDALSSAQRHRLRPIREYVQLDQLAR